MIDYIRDKRASENLATKIQNWWHSRGYTQVRVWVEEAVATTDYGTKLPSNFYVRSNIQMNCVGDDLTMID